MSVLDRVKGKPDLEPRWGVSSLDWADVADEIIRETGGIRFGGLRVKADRLSNGEQHRLAALTRKARDESERLEWEGLIERAAAEEGVFQRAREMDAARRELADLAKQARGPSLRLRPAQELGLFREINAQLAGGYLFASHVAVLAVVMSAIASGETTAPGGRVEGATVIVNRNYGLLPVHRDEHGTLGAWESLLGHLQANAWVEVRRSGFEVRISLGSRSRRALGLDAKKAKRS
jgi:hypothetical protein